MLRPLVSALLAAGVAAMFVRPADAGMHATKEFEAGDTRPKTIAFLPPHATLVKRKVIKAEEQIDVVVRLDVRDAPGVATDAHRAAESSDV